MRASILAQVVVTWAAPPPPAPPPPPEPPAAVDICQVTPDAPQCQSALKFVPITAAPAPPNPDEKGEQAVTQVQVRAPAPPRSASDWQVDPDVIASVPHETGADVLGTLPGVYVSNRGLLGQAPRLSVRGFEGTSGQDMEIFVGNVPMNQVSNVRTPGYADMRLVIPEAIHSVSISHGPYDPHQGDFAIAGSTHMDLGLEKPGFLGKASVGSFGSRRAVLAFSPPVDDHGWSDSFAAIETYAMDGPGSGRAGQRTSFVGQLSYMHSDMSWRLFVLAGTARFDFPGLLSARDVRDGEYPYSSISPLGRDLTSQTHVGNEFEWVIKGGTLTLGAFLSMTKMQIHEDLTGFVLDLLAGMPPTNSDDAEQVNEATTYGLNIAYRHPVKLLSDRDRIEVGSYARIDTIDQTDTRLHPDGTIDVRTIDATIDATNIAGYVDTAVYPFPRVVVRGGARVDSVAYSVTNHLGNEGLDRTTAGVNLGGKAMADYAAGHGVHVVASYGEGFRSPQARDLAEGQHVPFATIQSVEAGARMKTGKKWQGSLVGFGSWLSQDRVFDPLVRESTPAPSSSRLGAAAALAFRLGIFGTNVSVTYARAVFTGSDDRFHDGDGVPYAPSFVLRDDVFAIVPLGRVSNRPVVGRFGVGLQEAGGAVLPGGGAAANVMYVDALASASWREFELGLNAMNVFNQRYDDVEYFYTSNFAPSASLPPPQARVLVAPPASVFATLRVQFDFEKPEQDEAP